MKGKLLIAATLLLSACNPNGANDEAAKIDSIYELNGHHLAALSGSIYEHFIADSLKDSKLMTFASVAEILMAVSTDKCEYALLDQANTITINLEEKGCRVLFDTPIGGGDYAFGFKHPESELSRTFNHFLDSLKSNGILDAIIAKWTGKDAVMPSIEAVNPSASPIEVGIYSTNFPFGFKEEDGFKGIEPEILHLFSQYIGRPVNIKGYEFASLLPSLASGRSEIISGTITVTEERSKNVLFSHPYFFSSTLCLCKAENASAKMGAAQWLKEGIYDNLIANGRWKMILEGLWMTIVISVFSILLGTLIGALVCWMRMSRVRILQKSAKIYLEILRGIPLLVFLMLMFYVVFATSEATAASIAIIAFAMNFGAFTSEIFRTGISSVDKGQREAGIALGFNKLQTFIFIILPQATKKILPVFKNEAVSLIKNTSIVGYIAIQDLTKASDMIRSRTFDAFFPLIVITILYFLLAWLFGRILDLIFKKI